MPESLFDVAGKVVMVTGGTSGIGLMIARGFVEAGASVYVSSRKREVCEQVARDLAAIGSCVAVPADLSTEDGVETVVRALSDRERALDVLVNNAGATWGAALEDYPAAGFDRVLGLNVRAPFALTVACLPLLRAAATAEDPARVINTSSAEASVVPQWENYAYPASKAALNQLTRHLARRLAREHVTVNAIAPGPFPSRMIAFAQDDRERWSEIERGIPLGRAGQPDDVAGATIFLASRAGAYLTGVVLPIDGGLSGAGAMS